MFSAIKRRFAKQTQQAARVKKFRHALQLEKLEDRKVMTVNSLSLASNGMLMVGCDDAADNVQVYQLSGQGVLVRSTSPTGVITDMPVPTGVKSLLIQTRGGNDIVTNSSAFPAIIYGGAGNDSLSGGSNADTIFGEDGADTLYGGAGNDAMYGGNGNDYLFAQDGNDILYGNAGTDTLYGMNGDDFLDAGSLGEFANGGDGNDFNAFVTTVNGASFNDISQGNSNNCFILGSMGVAALRGINLASRISYAGDGVYNVQLFKPTTTGYTPTTVQVNFNGTLKSTDPAAHFRGQEGESWQIIMNRALAQLLNVNLDTTKGGYAGDVLAAITGNRPVTQKWSDGTVNPFGDGVLNYLFNVGNSRPTIVSTHNAPNVDTTLFATDHVYMVVAVNIIGFTTIPGTFIQVPQYSVTLYNPHGVDNRDVGTKSMARSSGLNSDGLITISGAEFKRSFGEITFV